MRVTAVPLSRRCLEAMMRLPKAGNTELAAIAPPLRCVKLPDCTANADAPETAATRQMPALNKQH
jgi:hypothetical protein